MNKFLQALFGTAERTVVSVVVGVVFLWMTVSGSIGNLKVALNENKAAAPEAALDLATTNAQLAGQCYGDRTPRIFLTWPAINGVVQKQNAQGVWTSLVNSNTKTFYADWNVTLGTPYAYRIKKSTKVFSNIVKIRPTAIGCTVTPIASVASTTVPGHVAPFYNDEKIRLSVIGEPNRPVQWCYKFTPDTSPFGTYSGCEPKDASFNQKVAVDGTWSKDLSFHTGTVSAWFMVSGKKSNVLQFSIIPSPTGPAITVLGPNGGEVFDIFITKSIPITWHRNWMPEQTNGLVSIYYNTGGLNHLIAQNVPDGTIYQWNIRDNLPQLGDSFKIVVTSQGFGGNAMAPLSDESDATFSLINAEIPPTF